MYPRSFRILLAALRAVAVIVSLAGLLSLYALLDDEASRSAGLRIVLVTVIALVGLRLLLTERMIRLAWSSWPRQVDPERSMTLLDDELREVDRQGILELHGRPLRALETHELGLVHRIAAHAPRYGLHAVAVLDGPPDRRISLSKRSIGQIDALARLPGLEELSLSIEVPSFLVDLASHRGDRRDRPLDGEPASAAGRPPGGDGSPASAR